MFGVGKRSKYGLLSGESCFGLTVLMKKNVVVNTLLSVRVCGV